MMMAFTDRPTFVHKLANGLTVVARRDGSAPVVAIVTHVKAGYFDEPEPLVGISHVLEHMYFKGTERRSEGEIARETRAAGGHLNAGTIYDRTSYYTVLPSSALEQGLDIQADALRNSRIDEDELRRELLVIIQEAKRKLDNPAAVAQESLFETMFDVHRIRRWRIGTEEGLARLTRADVYRYYRELYRPANIVLSVAGDIDPDGLVDLVERHYGGMEAGEVVRDAGPAEPPRRGFRFREMSGDIARTRVQWGWHTPGTLDPDTARLDLLAVVLGHGRASRLYREVRDAGLVAQIGADNYTPVSIGVFGIEAELEPEKTAEALNAVAAVIARARHSDAAPFELARAKNILEARLVRRLETAEGQATLLAEWQALGDWRLLDAYMDALFAAGPADLRRVAERYLDPHLSTLLVYRPAASRALGWQAQSLAGKLFDEESKNGEVGSHSPAEVAETPATNPRVRSRATAVEPIHIEDGVHFYDAGGVRVVIRPRPGSRLVSMSMACVGGALDETHDNAGITSLMTRASIKGTARRRAAGLAEETESLGGVLVPSATADQFDWSLTLPDRHFEQGFELLADAALAPTFPAAEVERERANLLSDLERTRDDMAQYPMRLFLNAAYDPHAYGLSLEAMASAVERLTRQDLEAWHERSIRSAEPWVFVVGGVDPDAAASAIAPHLARIESHPRTPHEATPAWPAHAAMREESRDKAQTAMVLGFPGPSRLDRDLYAMILLSGAISGLGGRLFEELRSRHSLAYAVSAYPIARWRAGAFVGYIATTPARADEARSRLLDELDAVAREPLPEEEVERAKRFTIGAWQIRMQTNAAQLADLSRALLLGEGLERLRTFESRILAVTPEEIRAAAARYFDRGRLVEGVVRGVGGGR